MQLIRAYVHGRSAAARAVLRRAGHGRVLSPVLHSRSPSLQTRGIVPFTTATIDIAIANCSQNSSKYQGLCHFMSV